MNYKNPGKIEFKAELKLSPGYQNAVYIEFPYDVKEALDQNPTAKDKYMKLSYNHQRENFNWINEAKKEETRNSRIQKMIDKLS